MPLILAASYVAVWIWAAIDPLFPEDWLIENILVFMTVPLVVWNYRHRPLSDMSYVLIFAFMVLHTVGSHYTYAEAAPGEWAREAFGLERNHYDRVVHFAFGFLLAPPLRELILRTGAMREPWGSVFVLSLIASFSGLYEIIEWVVAQVVSPETGAAYLGTQGDEFDAQKDMALAIVGAAVVLPLIGLRERLRPRPAG